MGTKWVNMRPPHGQVRVSLGTVQGRQSSLPPGNLGGERRNLIRIQRFVMKTPGVTEELRTKIGKSSLTFLPSAVTSQNTWGLGSHMALTELPRRQGGK